MPASQHPVAIEHLPHFVTAPGDTDVLLVVMFFFLLAVLMGIGVFYFKLHSLPEQLAHRGQKVQLQVVAVLGLISLFTHNHAFWIAGLLLAIVPLPDFSTPLISIAGSLERLASAGQDAARPVARAARVATVPPAQEGDVVEGPAHPPPGTHERTEG